MRSADPLPMPSWAVLKPVRREPLLLDVQPHAACVKSIVGMIEPIATHVCAASKPASLCVMWQADT